MKRAGSDKVKNASCGTMPSPSADVMDTNSQYSSCETLDSHRSSEFDEKNEVNGNDSRRKVRPEAQSSSRTLLIKQIFTDFNRAHRLYSERTSDTSSTTKARL